MVTRAQKILGTTMSDQALEELDELEKKCLQKLEQLYGEGEQPSISPIVYQVLCDLLRAGPLEYGLTWVPDIIRGLGQDPDDVNDALLYLKEVDMVDLYWAPGTYREADTFDLSPTVSKSDAAMLRPGICGGMIGYARVRNDHPWRNFRSETLPTWMQVAEKASKYKVPADHQQVHKLLDAGAPLVVSWGLGRDSTAMLIGMAHKNIKVDAILYAEVGNEKPETYAYRPYFEKWLAGAGMPRVQTVKYEVEGAKYCTLEQECLKNGYLPPIAYGFANRKCSSKWKVVPQEKFLRGMPLVQEAWRQGLPVVRAVGFDSSPEDMKRPDRGRQNEMFVNWYPMIEWNWDLDRVKAEIKNEGLREPVKSACYFCSSSQPHEVVWLAEKHPEYIARIRKLEERGKEKTQKAEGLWFKSTKKRPGSWTEFIRQHVK